jgi:hypothetical protein
MRFLLLAKKRPDMDQSEEMFKLVKQWRKSGLSQSKFCKPQGITVTKFGHLVGKEKLGKKVSGSFVHISGQLPAPNESYQVIYPNGVKINYQENDLVTLSQLIKALLMFGLSSSHRYFLYQGCCDIRKGRGGGPL